MEQKKNYAIPLAFITLLYFMWGFVTCLNDILIPHFKQEFKLSYVEAMFVQFAFFGAYFFGSLIYFFISRFSGDPINRIGYKNGIVLGLIIAAFGAFLFYPAAAFESLPFFLSALSVLALGFTVLQIAVNPYVILLGNPETGSHRLSLTGAMNSFGTTIAPIIGGALILGGATAAVSGVESVKMPYLVLSGIFALLAVIFKMVQLPVFASTEKIEKGVGALAYSQLTLGILAIFFYVGAEVTVGSFIALLVGDPQIKGLPASAATIYVSLYWGSIMIGRFAGSVSVFKVSAATRKILMAVLPVVTFFVILIILRINAGNEPFSINDYLIYFPFIIISIIAFFIGQEKPVKTLFLFSVICIALLLLSLFTKGELAMWSVISLGLYNSIMWPAIFALAISGLGKYTSQGSSLLIMAISGGAVIPMIQGYVADNVDVHSSFIIPVFCYAYLAFYAWKVKGILTKQGIEYDKPISANH